MIRRKSRCSDLPHGFDAMRQATLRTARLFTRKGHRYSVAQPQTTKRTKLTLANKVSVPNSALSRRVQKKAVPPGLTAQRKAPLAPIPAGTRGRWKALDLSPTSRTWGVVPVWTQLDAADEKAIEDAYQAGKKS